MIYDHVFTPFRIADGRCTVAPESEWQNVKAASQVLVNADLFQEWKGRVQRDGRDIWKNTRGRDDRWIPEVICEQDWAFEKMPIPLSDVVRRVFALIDATPSTTWIVRTERPENVERMMPDFFMTLPFFDEEEAYRQPSPFVIDVSIIRNREKVQAERPNLWLGVTARTQAELDERLPKLLAIPAAVRFVDVVPGEAIDLSNRVPGGITPFDGWVPALHWVTVRGDADPVHPDWVRSLRDQATAAGVPFAFETWGEWAHSTQTNLLAIGDLRKYQIDDGVSDMGNGSFTYRVGRERSGRTIDGREWEEVPA